jgi:hypothetical protein
MTIYTPKKMGQAQLTAAEVTQYTVPGGVSAIVKSIILTNVTGGALTFTISIVPSGGTAGVTNRIVELADIDPYAVVTLDDVNQVLATGDFISAKASVAASINFRASGVEYV